MVVTTRAQRRRGRSDSAVKQDEKKRGSGGDVKVKGGAKAGKTGRKRAAGATTALRSMKREEEEREANKSDALDGPRFGLVQERYQHNLYHLVVQAILWNQTRGKQAIVILRELLIRYPTPEDLACAKEEDLSALLQPIGLFRTRAKRLLAMAQTWVDCPPRAGQVHKVRYRCSSQDDMYWEIAHLPGVGKYAIDSYRIFHRDQLLGLSSGWDKNKQNTTQSHDGAAPPHYEPEWKRVRPEDKDLRAFLRWAWKREGRDWSPSP